MRETRRSWVSKGAPHPASRIKRLDLALPGCRLAEMSAPTHSGLLSGRSSALGFEAQDTRYYSTPAAGPSRARSADSRSSGKFHGLNADWERIRYLEQQKKQTAVKESSNRVGVSCGAIDFIGSQGGKISSGWTSRSTHARKLASRCCSGHCAICLNAMHGSDWSRQIALLSLHESALQRRSAERRRRSELARQLLDSRAALAQVDAALLQAGQLSRPEQLAPLISVAPAPTSRPAQAAVASMSTTRLECPVSAAANIFGRARKFVPGAAANATERARNQRAAPAPKQQNSSGKFSKTGEAPTEARGQSRHINDIFRIPYEDSGAAAGERASPPMEEEQQKQPPPPPRKVEEPSQFLHRRRVGLVGVANSDKQSQPTPPTPPPTSKASGTMSVTGRQAQLLVRRMSTVEMVVHNEDGETEEVEIDVADAETEGGSQRSGSSISDRINRRRNSELAADIIRLSAAHRRREFVQLLNEHRAIVHQLQGGGVSGSVGGGSRRSNQRPPPLAGAIQEGSVDEKEK